MIGPVKKRLSASCFPAVLFLAAVVFLCVMSLQADLSAVTHPWILAAGSLLTFAAVRNPNTVMLQKIILLYVFFAIVNLNLHQGFNAELNNGVIHIPYSLVVMIMCLAGYLLKGRDHKSSLIFGVFFAGAVIILIHILVLWPVLKHFYNTGYESDPAVVGNISLFLILAATSMGFMDAVIIRKILSIIFTVLFSMVMWRNG